MKASAEVISADACAVIASGLSVSPTRTRTVWVAPEPNTVTSPLKAGFLPENQSSAQLWEIAPAPSSVWAEMVRTRSGNPAFSSVSRR